MKYSGLENPYYGKEVNDGDLSKPSAEKRQEIAKRTAEALGVRVTAKTDAAYVTSTVFKKQEADKFVKFHPKQSMATGAQERLVKITTQDSDPLQPPRFKHKRIPKGIPSPPPAVLRSPPRKLTAKDQQDLKIPPCVSNWKNAKGHTIPLHMRLMADGRNIQDLAVNKRFGRFSEALYTAEKEARKEIEERNHIIRNLELVTSMREEQELRDAATRAREEKVKIMASNISSVAPSERVKNNEERLHGDKPDDSEAGITAAQNEREAMRKLKKRELRREQRLTAAQKKKAKITRDSDREVTEKIALGVAQPTSKEAMFDQRLFNQSAGVEAGFGSDDDYNLYDKPLFTDRTEAALYKIREVKQEETANDRMKKILTKHPQPARAFQGTEKDAVPSHQGIEFEQKDIPSVPSKRHKDHE